MKLKLYVNIYEQEIPLNFVLEFYLKPSIANTPDIQEIWEIYNSFESTIGTLKKNDLKVNLDNMYPYKD